MGKSEPEIAAILELSPGQLRSDLKFLRDKGIVLPRQTETKTEMLKTIEFCLKEIRERKPRGYERLILQFLNLQAKVTGFGAPNEKATQQIQSIKAGPEAQLPSA
jgi:predicted ArsR family transcriptional regulator